MSEGHFERLDAAECVNVLGDAAIGRVAFEGPDGLTVIPLAFRLDGDRVVLRTAEGTRLAALSDDTPVAFEVDEFDAEAANGWSVLVRGVINRLPDESLDEGRTPRPYVPGERRVLLSISVDEISGRAVSAAE